MVVAFVGGCCSAFRLGRLSLLVEGEGVELVFRDACVSCVSRACAGFGTMEKECQRHRETYIVVNTEELEHFPDTQ
jgi:hypothetical protein